MILRRLNDLEDDDFMAILATYPTANITNNRIGSLVKFKPNALLELNSSLVQQRKINE